MREGIRYREFKNLAFRILVILVVTISVAPLIAILVYIFKQGISVINWGFLVHLPKPVGETGGGILNAVIGSFLIIAVAALIAIPVGVTVGVYFSEQSKTGIFRTAHLAVDILQGIPSIVIGIIIYVWFVKPFGKFSALSGSIALALMMLPSIIKSTEETLKLVPLSLKEASLALGVPYYKTIISVIIPAGLSGILNGIILGIARVSGETAPLLFTAFGNPFVNFNILKPTASLPLIIFNYATSPYDEWHKLAWGASFILVVVILVLNILTKIAEKKWKVQF
ncbi:MAG TPA: phosphate ABC transporter permease PstA [Bacteroidales bacterium]|nr:phosphate ABC transporter permease PstA [Bacteroidales bacterium]